MDRFFLFTWHSSLSSNCCNLFIWEHQISSSSLPTSEKTNIQFKLFHIHALFRQLKFLAIFWPVEVKCFNYSQLQVNKSLTTHLTRGQGSRVGNWRHANFILDPPSASPATPLCGCLLHGCYLSTAEEAINQHQTVTVSGMRIKKTKTL